MPPVKWVVVSDGSTDSTDQLVEKYAADHPWIELLRLPERRERHFAGKVSAFMAGYARMKEIDYDVVCSLDADISFEPGYFAFLLKKLSLDAQLGLVGTPFQEVASGTLYDYRFVSIEHVSGACQVFRRACFEDIGGYTPVKGGGIDHIAVVSSRMKGWKTRTFTDQVCIHHRPMGTAQHGALRARFKIGLKDHAFGNHPLWEAFRSVYQMSRKPFLIGGLATITGYCWATIRRAKRPISSEMVAFTRREQMARLRTFLMRRRSVTLTPVSQDEPARSSK